MELLRSCKGHGHIIKEQADEVGHGGTNSIWMFIGIQAQQRKTELSSLRQHIYDDVRDFHNIVYRMACSMNAAIEDVTSALSLNGMMTSSKVPAASVKLIEYAKSFKKLELLAEDTRNKLSATIQELQ